MALHSLAQGDILRIEAITRLKVTEVFTFMIYEQDVHSTQQVNINEHH